MTINNDQEYLNNLWDWGILRGCFGETIEPTDIDGWVERNGNYLYLETKAPNVELKKGQQIAFKNLENPKHTVMIINGPRNEPRRIEIYMKSKDNPTVIDPATLDDLRDCCRRWYEWADKHDNRPKDKRRNNHDHR